MTGGRGGGGGVGVVEEQTIYKVYLYLLLMSLINQTISFYIFLVNGAIFLTLSRNLGY